MLNTVLCERSWGDCALKHFQLQFRLLLKRQHDHTTYFGKSYSVYNMCIVRQFILEDILCVIVVSGKHVLPGLVHPHYTYFIPARRSCVLQCVTDVLHDSLFDSQTNKIDTYVDSFRALGFGHKLILLY